MKRLRFGRVTTLVVVVMVATLLASGVALAATFRGTDSRDRIFGTNGVDKIYAYGGADIIDPRSGADFVSGGFGADRIIDGPLREFNADKILGGYGNDYINTNNSPDARDYIDCGPGFDKVVGDPNDIEVGNTCERVIVASRSAAEQEEEKLP